MSIVVALFTPAAMIPSLLRFLALELAIGGTCDCLFNSACFGHLSKITLLVLNYRRWLLSIQLVENICFSSLSHSEI